jgi:CheY-like chemotaxis protein
MSLGIPIDLALSTNEALVKLHDSRTYDVIVSDMGRPPDSEAGYTLLRALREKKIQTPFVIYAGSDRPEYKRQAHDEGAQGSTGNPDELFELVIQAIRGLILASYHSLGFTGFQSSCIVRPHLIAGAMRSSVRNGFRIAHWLRLYFVSNPANRFM